MADKQLFLCFVLCLFEIACGTLICEEGYCRTFRLDEGCSTPAEHCRINNATHTGIQLPSPTLCNCCEYCLPFYGEGEHCSSGGPGAGTTVGRCGDGLTCVRADDGHSYCQRMDSKCHRAQDDYDAREAKGELGALEHRPLCDGKGKYSPVHCIPAHTCFCQSEEGERIFGEVLYLGAETTANMHCGCSRLHEKIKRSISPGVSYPVIGPRCTSDGNFNPVQCVGRTCYCVDRITGVVSANVEAIRLDEEPITKLDCYTPELDLHPELSDGERPYNYTTTCFENQQEVVELIEQSRKEGYNLDFFSGYPECLPDGTFGRVAHNRNGSKVCVDERGRQIEGFEAARSTPEYDSMDCKCAITSLMMETSPEKPSCCKNGNFRKIQCRRGACWCVDGDGRQTEKESTDVTELFCYRTLNTTEWRTC